MLGLLGLYAKNRVEFGHFGAATLMGLNTARYHVPPERIQETALHHVGDRGTIDQYSQYIDPLDPRVTSSRDISVLRPEPNGPDRLNDVRFILVSERLLRDVRATATFRNSFKHLLLGANRVLDSPIDYHFFLEPQNDPNIWGWPVDWFNLGQPDVRSTSRSIRSLTPWLSCGRFETFAASGVSTSL